jgi:hypothetical protein
MARRDGPEMPSHHVASALVVKMAATDVVAVGGPSIAQARPPTWAQTSENMELRSVTAWALIETTDNMDFGEAWEMMNKAQSIPQPFRR